MGLGHDPALPRPVGHSCAQLGPKHFGSAGLGPYPRVWGVREDPHSCPGPAGVHWEASGSLNSALCVQPCNILTT